jgi:hypothetical protein
MTPAHFEADIGAAMPDLMAAPALHNSDAPHMLHLLF